MKYIDGIIGVSLLVFSSVVLAASSTGKITKVSMASTVGGTSRAGTVQFSIEGGFGIANCNQTYAAILKEDTHMVSLLLLAKSQDKPIEVFLDVNNKYLQDRCAVNFLDIQ